MDKNKQSTMLLLYLYWISISDEFTLLLSLRGFTFLGHFFMRDLILCLAVNGFFVWKRIRVLLN